MVPAEKNQPKAAKKGASKSPERSRTPQNQSGACAIVNFGPREEQGRGPSQRPVENRERWAPGAAMLAKFCGQHKKGEGDKVAVGARDESSSEDEEDVQARGGGYMIRAVGVEGGDGGFRKGRGTLARLAESEAAKTVIIPDWNGDMFLWGEFARKFNAFRTAVATPGGGRTRTRIFGSEIWLVAGKGKQRRKGR